MAIAFAALVATAHGVTINFDKDRPGALPTGWIAGPPMQLNCYL